MKDQAADTPAWQCSITRMHRTQCEDSTRVAVACCYRYGLGHCCRTCELAPSYLMQYILRLYLG